MVYANGKLPAEALRQIPGTSRYIAKELYDQIVALRAAFSTRFGKPLVVTDAYRSYEGQVAARNRYLAGQGAYAVVPGTSNHGWGRAVDLGSRVNILGTEEHNWMVANGPRFGFTWLKKAGNGSIEPWHFDGTVVPVSNYFGNTTSIDSGVFVTGPAPITPRGFLMALTDAQQDQVYNWLREMQPPVVSFLPMIKEQIDALNVADTRNRIGNIQFALGLLLSQDPKTISAADIAAAIPTDIAEAVVDELKARL